MNPEEKSRLQIDKMLSVAGWQVQSKDELNPGAAPGVAICEFPLETGEADYLLFVNRQVVGVVEAKPEGKLTAEWRAAHRGEIEPASMLLERISAERELLGRANGRTKSVRVERVEYIQPQRSQPEPQSVRVEYIQPQPQLARLPDRHSTTTRKR